jgi:hypothetical protein
MVTDIANGHMDSLESEQSGMFLTQDDPETVHSERARKGNRKTSKKATYERDRSDPHCPVNTYDRTLRLAAEQ